MCAANCQLTIYAWYAMTNILSFQPLQCRILHIAHEGHPGIVRAKRSLRATCWWPSLDTHVENFIRHCPACQDSAKAHKRIAMPHITIPKPTEPWHKIGLDICGPFATAPRHQRFVTTVIDHASGYSEVLLSTNITWLTEVFARFGNPAVIVSDNGRQFISEEFTNFLASRDIQQQRAAVYNPQQNGLVELFNRFLKHGIQTFNAAKKTLPQAFRSCFLAIEQPATHLMARSQLKSCLGRRPRTNFQPAFRSSTTTACTLSSSYVNETEQQHNTPWFRGPYQVNDVVRVRLSQVPKGCSPFSKPLWATKVLGKYTHTLDDGQVWNARKLVRYRDPTQQYVLVERERNEAVPPAQPPRQAPRRSSRRTRRWPPLRYLLIV